MNLTPNLHCTLYSQALSAFNWHPCLTGIFSLSQIRIGEGKTEHEASF